MCLAQGKTVTPVRLEPTVPRSPVKHSTTEPLRSHIKGSYHRLKILKNIVLLSLNIDFVLANSAGT